MDTTLLWMPVEVYVSHKPKLAPLKAAISLAVNLASDAKRLQQDRAVDTCASQRYGGQAGAVG
jgi:hypothetical protein